MKKIFKSLLAGIVMSLVVVLITACNKEHIHSFTISKSNEIIHWKECSCGEKTEEEDHIFGEWVTTKEATETDEGIKEKVCSDCHFKLTEKIPVLMMSTTVDADIWNNAFNNIDKVDNCKIVLIAPEINSSNTILKCNDYYGVQLRSNKDASNYMYYTKNSNLENNYIGLQQHFTKVDGNYYDIDNKKGYETLDELIKEEGRKWDIRYGSGFETFLVKFKFIDKFDEFNYDNQTKAYVYHGEIEAEFINLDSSDQMPIKCQVFDPIIKFKDNHIEYLKLNTTLGWGKSVYEYEAGKTVFQQDLIDSYWEALFTFELNEDKKSYSLCKANKMNLIFSTSDPVILHLPEMYKGLPVTHIGQNTFIEYFNDYGFPFQNITLVIPSNIKHIGIDAFCSYFKKVYYDGFVDDWCNIEFANTSSNPMTYARNFYLRNSNNEWEEPTDIVIPNDITIIGAATFSGCGSLTSVVIPNSVTKIGLCAFLYCNNLKDVYYTGSPTEWCNISIENGSNILNYITIHYNFGSEHETSHKHSYLTKSDSETHWLECSCNDKKEIANHSYSEWITTKEPSETEEGTKERECNVCHYKEIEKLPIIVIEKLAFTLNTDGKSYSVSGIGNVSTSTVVIPSIYNNLPVTSIAQKAFYQCHTLENITIPACVTTIENYAFYDCKNLINVFISEGTTTIKRDAFTRCYNLTSIVIPSSITNIESLAFNHCYRLVEVYNLSSVTIIKGDESTGKLGYYAKVIHTSLEEESHLIYKDDYVFVKDNENKYYLVDYNGTATELVLPDNIDGNDYEINTYAFYRCSSLINVTIPDCITTIGEGAFSVCYNIENFTLPDSILSIGSFAFNACEKLTSIDIPNNITAIPSRAFNNCYKLKNVVIPDKVTSIGTGAFSKCSSLTSIEIPNSVTSIGADAFAECDSLVYNEFNAGYYLGNKENPYIALIKIKTIDITNFEINSNTKVIASEAFLNCSSLTSVIIPNSVTSIGKSAFENCRGLTSITIPKSVTSIESRAFFNCSSLTCIYYGEIYNEWCNIIIGDYNSELTSATIYYYSETQPTTSGNYWHYVDGVVTKWN